MHFRKPLPKFDKYALYFASVQDPEESLRFFERVYHKANGKKFKVFREDFCGTYAVSCAWVKRGADHRAYAVDLDPEPVKYGSDHYFAELLESEKKRVTTILADVRSPHLPKADVVAAMNFSFFIFKERKDLLDYFRNVHGALNPQGLFVLDAFGGIETGEPNIDEEKYDTHTYYWEQVGFDPVTHSAKFYIHFKRRGEKRRDRVFTYDWRMWTLPELTDLLKEAGFRGVDVYWEGDDGKGGGNGIFRRVERAENCKAWITYLVAHR